MPFTLAHPAAVLPLCRFCPRYCSFPALIVGSVVPDLGYAFGSMALDSLSHRFTGSIVFCLPVGLLILALFYGLRSRLLPILPGPYRRIFLPLFRQAPSSAWVMVTSLLVACWIHLLLDSWTHENGWLVERLPILQYPIARFGYRALRVHAVLGYALSFAGIVWLALAYGQWRRFAEGEACRRAGWEDWRNGILLALLFVPVTAVRHIYGGPLSLVFVAVASMLLTLVAALWIGAPGLRRNG
ncbi:MAG: DUF4184 family protein [Chthoniobacteraceae bacterium]